MKRTVHLFATTAAGACLALLAACGGTVSDAYVVENDPGSVEEVAEGEIPRVSVTEGAARRLQIATTAVEPAGDALTVPNTAVFVDTHGIWWVYTNPEPLVFERAEVDIVDEDDTHVVYQSGPEAGTEVVTVGVAELAGIEEDSGH